MKISNFDKNKGRTPLSMDSSEFCLWIPTPQMKLLKLHEIEENLR